MDEMEFLENESNNNFVSENQPYWDTIGKKRLRRPEVSSLFSTFVFSAHPAFCVTHFHYALN